MLCAYMLKGVPGPSWIVHQERASDSSHPEKEEVMLPSAPPSAAHVLHQQYPTADCSPVMHSAEGVSLTANYAELVAYSITIAYNMDHGTALSGLLPPMQRHHL